MTVGQRIKAIRKERKLTQVQLADKANLSRSYLADIERDRYNPSLSTLESVAGALGVQVSAIVGEENLIKEEPAEYNAKEEKDIAKRMEEIRRDLENSDGLSFSGEPMSPEAIESLMEAMEHIVRQTQRINKKYTPKKYRKDDQD
ncbi:helix-turn-helix transcriptional regulator [Bacillus subtilis]|uniref:helix-turn-helix domain-containing protein n=1 Tax=Bacillus TaxID=1386 RepID=UPI000CD1D3E5|nr:MULTISPECIES: helix-turn-helix transcriptional regulator [Bacillus subtilis group]MEC0534321.1 helix-turn-helix transcriptional regulator [Bacillus spizizenii]MEC0607068.1 helix-turn-helix transcriptional regulator [Bacillus inaquosorum]MCY8546878.1 helix-turn-helix domain-containing protein [Bacillus vallismortis]MDK7659015.1 helix-turn-helix transcriptional regulator [Bacillus subtilis]MEC0566004.1 helix-turn-helix transcriptional regulator [Bacillus spizizenii]